jgi:predicted ATPase with chaperone activity
MGNLRTGQKYTPDDNHRLIIVVTFSHVKGLLKFPAYFQLIAATNPCPCCWRNDAQNACSCAVAVVTKYQKRISGPPLDGIDLHIGVPRVDYEKLSGDRVEEILQHPILPEEGQGPMRKAMT